MAVVRVDIDTQVLAAAKRAFGVRTDEEAIDLALRDALTRRQQLEAIDVLAGLPVEVDPRPIRYGAA